MLKSFSNSFGQLVLLLLLVNFVSCGSKGASEKLKEILSPSSVVLGSNPNSLSVTPSISWSSLVNNKVQVAVYRVDDDALIKDWTEISNGGQVSSLSLQNYEQYYVKLRGFDNGTSSGEVQTESWTANLPISSQTHTKSEVGYIKDIEFARNKYWVIPGGGSLNTTINVKTASDLTQSLTNEVALEYPQAMLSHDDEIYIFHQSRIWRGDSATVTLPNEAGYASFKPSISDGNIYTGTSTGSGMGNRYFIADLASFSLIKDIRDFESGNGKGNSIRPFKGELFFSGLTHNNSGNTLHVHKGNTNDETTVSSLSIVNIGFVADDNEYEDTMMEEVEEKALFAGVYGHDKYSYTLDGITWTPQNLPSNETLRDVLSDEYGFFVLVRNSSDGSEHIYRFLVDDMNNPSIVHSLSDFSALSRMKVINEELYVVGNNSSGEGLVEVVSNLYNRPAGI